MPTYDFKCKGCGRVSEWNTNKSLPKEMQVPEACPSCGGKLIRQFSARTHGLLIDVPGGYESTYGKKAWKRNLSTVEQAMVLNGDKAPY